MDLKRWILTIVGCLLGVIFLWLAFRDVSLYELAHGIRQMHLWYLIPCALLLMGAQLARAFRFGVIVSPFCELNLRSLWDLVNIWNAANMILPGRLGELVRPYLLQQRGISFSSVFGAVMVERFFDLSALLFLLGIVLLNTQDTPQTFLFLGKMLLIFLTLGYVLVLVLLVKRELAVNFVRKITSVLPKKVGNFIEVVFEKLLEGLTIMSSAKQAGIIFLYSVLVWLLFSTTTYCLLLAFSIESPYLVAVTIQVFIALGVALPSAPGFVGTFHAAGRYALSLFGVGSVIAISFATVYHLFNLLLTLLLGVVSYATGDYRFKSGAVFSKSHT